MVVIRDAVAVSCDRCAQERSLKTIHLQQWQGYPGEETLAEWDAALCRGCAHEIGVRWSVANPRPAAPGTE